MTSRSQETLQQHSEDDNEPSSGWASTYLASDVNTSTSQYTAAQRKRIREYLKESDSNCKESATLVTIILAGLLIAGSVVGFLALRNHSSVKYKGSHLEYVDDESVEHSIMHSFLIRTFLYSCIH